MLRGEWACCVRVRAVREGRRVGERWGSNAHSSFCSLVSLAMRASFRSTSPSGRIVTVDNYGLVADDLRRELRVAQVVCLSS